MELQKKSNTTQIVAFALFAVHAIMYLTEIIDFLSLAMVLGYIAMALGMLFGNTTLLTVGAGVELGIRAYVVINNLSYVYDDFAYLFSLILAPCILVVFWLCSGPCSWLLLSSPARRRNTVLGLL